MKILAPPSAPESPATSVSREPVTEPPGPTDAEFGEAIRVQDLPLPASIQALRTGARNGSRSRGPLDDSAPDAEPVPADAGRSGRGGTRGSAPPSDRLHITVVAPPPPPPPPSRPSEYTGEAPVGQQ